MDKWKKLMVHIGAYPAVLGKWLAVGALIGGVGGDAGEGILHLNAGGVGAYGDLVGVAGVPGNGGVQILEKAVSRHKGLTRAAFLAGASVENNGSLQLSGSNGILDGDSRGDAPPLCRSCTRIGASQSTRQHAQSIEATRNDRAKATVSGNRFERQFARNVLRHFARRSNRRHR